MWLVIEPLTLVGGVVRPLVRPPALLGVTLVVAGVVVAVGAEVHSVPVLGVVEKFP